MQNLLLHLWQSSEVCQGCIEMYEILTSKIYFKYVLVSDQEHIMT